MRQKFIPLFISFSLLILQLNAQDILISTNGSKDTVTITEITPELIKFSRAEHPGISYSKLKIEIFSIQYANGTTELVNDDATKQSNGLTHSTDKGNKVFIQADNTVEQLIVPFLKEYLTKWNYWKIADNINESDFILDLNFIKSKGIRGFVVLKNKDGIEISRSRNIKAKNGYRDCALIILKEYLKKRYW